MAVFRGFVGKEKIGCCYQCEDRVVEPNCHDTCEKYLKELNEWKEKQAFLRKAREGDRIYNDHHIRRVTKCIREKTNKEKR